MSMAQETGQVYALLVGGTTVEIRPAAGGDFDAVKAMHEAMSPDNTYMRFFNLSRRPVVAGESAARAGADDDDPEVLTGLDTQRCMRGLPPRSR